MNSQMIKCFLALCQTHNFTKAAEALYMSQSSLSKYLKSLEDELNCQLIDRGKTPIGLTSAGEIFLKYSNELTTGHSRLLTELQPYQTNIEQSLRISAIPLVLDYGAVRTITTFQTLHPKLKLEYMECDQKQAVQSLNNRIADIGIVRIDTLDLALYDHVLISEEKLVVACSASSPHAQKGTLSLSELRNEPFITYDDSSALYSFIISVCKQHGFSPNIVNTSSRVNIVVGMICENAGISLLPVKLAQSFESKFPISIIELSDPICSKTAFIKMKSAISNQTVVSAFWKHICNNFN